MEPAQILTTLFVLSAAVSAVSMILAKSTLFERPRDWVKEHSKFFGQLVNCPLCTSVWVSALTTAVFAPVLVPGSAVILQLLVSWLAIVAVAAPISGIIYKSFSQME